MKLRPFTHTGLGSNKCMDEVDYMWSWAIGYTKKWSNWKIGCAKSGVDKSLDYQEPPSKLGWGMNPGPRLQLELIGYSYLLQISECQTVMLSSVCINHTCPS